MEENKHLQWLNVPVLVGMQFKVKGDPEWTYTIIQIHSDTTAIVSWTDESGRHQTPYQIPYIQESLFFGRWIEVKDKRKEAWNQLSPLARDYWNQARDDDERGEDETIKERLKRYSLANPRSRAKKQAIIDALKFEEDYE